MLEDHDKVNTLLVELKIAVMLSGPGGTDERIRYFTCISALSYSLNMMIFKYNK